MYPKNGWVVSACAEGALEQAMARPRSMVANAVRVPAASILGPRAWLGPITGTLLFCLWGFSATSRAFMGSMLLRLAALDAFAPLLHEASLAALRWGCDRLRGRGHRRE